MIIKRIIDSEITGVSVLVAMLGLQFWLLMITSGCISVEDEDSARPSGARAKAHQAMVNYAKARAKICREVARKNKRDGWESDNERHAWVKEQNDRAAVEAFEPVYQAVRDRPEDDVAIWEQLAEGYDEVK